MRRIRWIETRLTYNHGGKLGIHTDNPLGLITGEEYQGRQMEIVSGPFPIFMRLDTPELGWATLNYAAYPMTKFRYPEQVEPHYRQYKFWFEGKKYILEMRMYSITEYDFE